MRISSGQSVTHLNSGDRREEFVAVLADVLPRIRPCLETVGLYTMVAAFWGVILYVALTVFVLQ